MGWEVQQPSVLRARNCEPRTRRCLPGDREASSSSGVRTCEAVSPIGVVPGNARSNQASSVSDRIARWHGSEHADVATGSTWRLLGIGRVVPRRRIGARAARARSLAVGRDLGGSLWCSLDTAVVAHRQGPRLATSWSNTSRKLSKVLFRARATTLSLASHVCPNWSNSNWSRSFRLRPNGSLSVSTHTEVTALIVTANAFVDAGTATFVAANGDKVFTTVAGMGTLTSTGSVTTRSTRSLAGSVASRKRPGRSRSRAPGGGLDRRGDRYVEQHQHGCKPSTTERLGRSW